MNISTADLYGGLQYGTSQGISAAALFEKFLNGNTGEQIQKNSLLKPVLDFIALERDKFLKKDITVLPWSAFKLFDTDGNRLEYEAHYFERRQRLCVLALSAWLWENPADIAALEDCIWAICDEYSWCLPAHMAGTSLSAAACEDNRKATNNTRLDLFACETGFALAECCAMLEKHLAPAVTARVRGEVRRRVIQSYVEHGELWNWELMENNWCAVCAGSIAGAALYLAEDDLSLAGILQKLMPTFNQYIKSFYPDGASAEGLSYWTYGMSFYVSFGDLLLQRTGGKINIFDDPQFKKIAAFQQQCYFPGGAVINFSDASDKDMFRIGLSCYLAEHIEGIKVPALPYKASYSLLDPCGRFTPALRDLVWARENIPITDDKPHVTVFPDAQWLLCSGDGETGFAAKGGHNDESHNHNDVGNFIFYKKGKMAICDLGAGEYTKDYFGDKRYEIFCNQSLSHNVPIINGCGQKAGREFEARDCRISNDGGMALDIAGAYKIPELLRLEREFSFNIHTGVLLLKDTFSFAENPLPVTERFISLFPPVPENGLVRIGGLCTLKSQISPVISEVEHRDHKGKPVTVYTIDFNFLPKDTTLSVEFVIE
ncbi:heparinase [Spirochaetia bacterium]|nr:heparinase [Spirochaetia bacterium]